MKNTPLIIGVIILILLAIGGYLYMNKSQSPLSMTGGENTQRGGMKSLKELMMMGQNQMCTFSYADDNGSSEGTSYIAGGKVRTDFSGTDQDGKSYNGSMISDGTYAYTWTSYSPEGMKMKITDETTQTVEDVKDDAQKNPNQYVDPDAKVDYKCQGWSVDESKFTPPADITFTDFSALQEQMQQQTGSSGAQDKCAACDSLTGEAQTACKSALGC